MRFLLRLLINAAALWVATKRFVVERVPEPGAPFILSLGGVSLLALTRRKR